MLPIIMKLMLLLLGSLLIPPQLVDLTYIVAFLVAIIVTGFNYYFSNRIVTIVTTLLYFGACIYAPQFMLFLPLFCFGLMEDREYKLIPLMVIPLVGHMSYLAGNSFALLILFIIIGGFTQYLIRRIEALTLENHSIRDDNTEYQNMLLEQNEHLIENQESSIRLATLRERNRIAREIHDNVGHLLSRSILQIGVAQTLNKDEQLGPTLDGLKETLDSAMNSIRGSVHDLRDDSINLQEAIEKMLSTLTCEVEFDYNLTNEVPNNVKFCFLGILKEALTNLAKHSDATEFEVTVREHPALYQLLIHDNGTVTPDLSGRGMGLSNMEERVMALDGQFHLSYEDGFRIFASIPKAKE